VVAPRLDQSIIFAMLHALCAMQKNGFQRWCRIGWKNICKLWLEESTPEKLKGESE